MSSHSDEIELFREYLRIPSVSDQLQSWKERATTFLADQARRIGLSFQILHYHADTPLWLMTWTGSDPSLGSILLTSHVDVVPVFPDMWKYPPFDATVDNGKIYARGAQDMKVISL